MSLAVQGERRRDRSRSRSRDRRPKDEPERESRLYSDMRESSYGYPDDGYTDRHDDKYGKPDSGRRLAYPSESSFEVAMPGSQSSYQYDDKRSSHRDKYSRPESPELNHVPGSFPDDDESRRSEKDDRYKSRKEGRDSKYSSSKYDDYEYSDKRDSRRGEPRRDKEDKIDAHDDPLKYLPQKYSQKYEDKGDSRRKSRRHRSDSEDEDLTYGGPPPFETQTSSPPTYGSYIPSSGTVDKRSSKYKDDYSDDRRRDYSPERDDRSSRKPKGDSYREYLEDSKSSKAKDDSYRKYLDDAKSSKSKDEFYRESLEDSKSYKSKDDFYREYLEDAKSSKSKDDFYREYLESSKSSKAKGDSYREYLEDSKSSKSKGDSHREYLDDPKSSKSTALTVEPSRRTRDRSRDGRRDASPGPALLTAESDKHGRDKTRERSRDRRSSKRDSSPLPLTTRMSSLTVDTNRPVSMSLAAAPGSPLLESYHGTYQDCSPMPSPLLLASQAANEPPKIIDALSPLNSDVEGDGKKRSRRARFHDPEDIASRLARALKGDRPPDTEPLIEILPSLSHDQVMELRTEYKRIVKTGSDRKGVNIAKHIRARLKDEDPLLMKACYSVALGIWEGEAYWANFWYQGDKTRRELLIETLMGRTNDEIRLIKDAFTDKKYDNSLTKCMKTELKEDKFKKAVLTVLEERRMEDFDQYGRTLPLDYDLVDRDVDELRKAVKAEKGGESLMIAIVLQRSDSHLRAVLKEYERHYRGNFARESLKKSGNLVVRFRAPSSFSLFTLC